MNEEVQGYFCLCINHWVLHLYLYITGLFLVYLAHPYLPLHNCIFLLG